MSRWRDARAWVPALVCLACLLGLGRAYVSPAPQGDAPATGAQISDEGRALLGELAVGERLAGWTVTALDGPREGMLRIDLHRDDVRFALLVAKKGTRPESAPRETERYVIYHGHEHPKTALPEGTIHATTHALALRIRAHEATVDVPGL